MENQAEKTVRGYASICKIDFPLHGRPKSIVRSSVCEVACWSKHGPRCRKCSGWITGYPEVISGGLESGNDRQFGYWVVPGSQAPFERPYSTEPGAFSFPGRCARQE